MRPAFFLFLSLVFVSTAEAQEPCKRPSCGGACTVTDSACRADSATGVATTSAQRPASAIPDSAKYVGSIRGHTYYLIGCSGANKLLPELRIFFKDEKEAKASGYKHSSEKGC